MRLQTPGISQVKDWTSRLIGMPHAVGFAPTTKTYLRFSPRPRTLATTLSPTWSLIRARSSDEVLQVARAGEKLGCTEALFSLGDKPELIFPEMRETLRKLGFRSTLHYLEAMCELVLRETSLLPHPNPGLMSVEWITRLAAVSPSMGLMLETTNDSLLAPGKAHDNAPDKIPVKRLP